MKAVAKYRPSRAEDIVDIWAKPGWRTLSIDQRLFSDARLSSRKRRPKVFPIPASAKEDLEAAENALDGLVIERSKQRGCVECST